MLNSKDFGHGLMTTQLQSHERLENELAVIREEVKDLDNRAQHLMRTHPDQAQSISNSQAEINNRSEVLTKKATSLESLLQEHGKMERFRRDFR